MADNTTINRGQGGDTIATEDISGVKAQRVKLMTGAAGVDGGNVTPTNPLPAQEPQPATGTLTNVSGNTINQQLLASNASRKGALFYNDSTAALYLKLGATASSSSFTTILGASGYYELPTPCYTGRIDGVWASTTGTLRVTELT